LTNEGNEKEKCACAFDKQERGAKT
jgi:hypothetical protein